MLSSCSICPRACRVDRTAGATGICGQTDKVRLARAALHFWEEPPISGEQGSGTVFFSGCPLNCVYCQNKPIATGDVGKEVTVERLAEIFLEQQGRGAHNINLVTPTHFASQIKAALDIAHKNGLILPVVYNCAGYETVEAIQALEGYIDIFLTDFKYASPELALRYSKAKDYPQIATRALDAMFELVGPCVFDSEGMMTRGVIVRHLLLPGHLDDSKAVLHLLALKPYSDDIILSIMSQYTPMEGVGRSFPELGRKVTDEEYDELLDYSIEVGFEEAFCQDGECAEESFIPAFDYEGV